MAKHWRAIIAHYTLEVDCGVQIFKPAPVWQDLALGHGGCCSDEVITAFVVARLTLTYEWSGCRKNVGVFVLNPDGQMAAFCCFSDGRIVQQGGSKDMFGRLKT